MSVSRSSSDSSLGSVEYTSSDESSTESSPKGADEGPTKIVWFALAAVVLSVIFVILALLDIIKVSSGIVNELQHGYHAAFFMLITICVFKALCSCEKFRSKFRPYSGLDVIVVLSQSGIFLNNFMSLLVLFAQLGRKAPATGSYYIFILPVCGRISSTVSVCLQTTLMLHASRIEVLVGQEQKLKCLKQCLMFTAVSNAFICIVDGFITIQNLDTANPYQIDYFGSKIWTFVTQLTLPLSIFYRFNSCFMLLGGLLDHCRNPQLQPPFSSANA